MIKTILNAGSVSASASVPMTLDANTNNKTSLVDNAIVLKDIGLWNVKVNAICDATTTGDVTMQLYANGNAISGATSTMTVASGDAYTFNINDVVRTMASPNSFAKLTVQFNQPVTMLSGDMIVEYLR